MKLGYKRCWVFLLAIFLLACGKKIEGTFEDPIGLSRYTFNKNGTALVEMLGVETELEYEVEGDRVKLLTKDGKIILRMRDSKTLEGPMGIVLSKK